MKQKLLILGGMALSCEIVNQAHKMGIEVYVTDYLPDSPAKKIADKSFMVSTTDVAAVVQLIKQEKIDGVITGYVDLLLPYYVEICKQANLPCYATAEQVNITTDKEQFKQLCIEHSIPVVPEYTLEDVLNGSAKYPILVKPVDNSGARGIYICHNLEEFRINYEKSLAFSPSKHVIIERYMQGKEATIFYYIHKGEIYLLGMGDRHMKRFDKKLIPLPIGYTFPAITLPKFINNENINICQMFRTLGMREGMIFMQTFVENDECIVYEMGYRLTGSIEHHLFEYVYNFNNLEAIINIALGNDLNINILKQIDANECCMANLTLLIKSGYLSEYIGLENIKKMDGVLYVYTSRTPGTYVDEKVMGTLAQVEVRVLLYANNRAQLIERMDTIKNVIKILDDNGNNLLIDNYSYADIIQ